MASARVHFTGQTSLTCNTGKQLPCEILNLAAGKRHKGIALEKVKDALSIEVGDDADVAAKVKAVSQVNAFVFIVNVVHGQCSQHSQLNTGGISVFLDRADDFDGTSRLLLLVICLDDFAKGTLAKQTSN